MKYSDDGNNSNNYSKLKFGRLFLVAVIIVLSFGTLIALSIYYNVKLQKFHSLQIEIYELRLLWNKYENSTKELFVTFNLQEASTDWEKSFLHFVKKFNHIMTLPFTKQLSRDDLDFRIKFNMITMYFFTVEKKYEAALNKLINYEKMVSEKYNSGNILVNFAKKQSDEKQIKNILDLLSDLRWFISMSDYTFSKVLDDIGQYITASIHEKTLQIQAISLILSISIFSILGVFILSQIMEIISEQEKAKKNSEKLKAIITRQNETENLLRSERDKFQGVLSVIGEKLYIVNKDYEIYYQNEELNKQHGNCIGQKCFHTYWKAEKPCIFCYVNRIRGINNTETKMYDRNYEIVYAPFKDNEGKRKTIVLWKDITEKRQYEAEVARAGFLASIGELAASVAHEINNPINGIISIAEVLRDETENNEYRQLLIKIIKESDRIATIVEKLLNFSRNNDEQFAPVNLKDILDDSLTFMQNQIHKYSIDLILDFPSHLPTIRVQQHEIQQVFVNLINNSIYSLKEKISGKDPSNFIFISALIVEKANKKYIRTTFYDGGLGIPKEYIDKVCDPFFTTKPQGKGTGLGLSISQNIIQNHGGKLSIESVESSYTKVHVDLPMA